MYLYALWFENMSWLGPLHKKTKNINDTDHAGGVLVEPTNPHQDLSSRAWKEGSSQHSPSIFVCPSARPRPGPPSGCKCVVEGHVYVRRLGALGAGADGVSDLGDEGGEGHGLEDRC